MWCYRRLSFGLCCFWGIRALPAMFKGWRVVEERQQQRVGGLAGACALGLVLLLAASETTGCWSAEVDI